MIVGEYDRYVPSLPGPRNLDVLAHSPIPGQANWSDLTYFTAPGKGGGVLASGSAYFVYRLANSTAIPPTSCPAPFPARPTSSCGPWRTSTGCFGRAGRGHVRRRRATGRRLHRGGGAAGSAVPTNAA
jgi:hypothetical protein